MLLSIFQIDNCERTNRSLKWMMKSGNFVYHRKKLRVVMWPRAADASISSMYFKFSMLARALKLSLYP